MPSYSWLQMLRMLNGQEPGEPDIPDTQPCLELQPKRICDLLQAGCATVTGLPIGGGRREPVPSLQWDDMHIELSTKEQFTQGRHGFGIVARLPAFNDGWYDLRIDEREAAKLKTASNGTASAYDLSVMPENFGPSDPDPWMQPLEALQWLHYLGLPIEEGEPALYLALKLGQILATGECDRAGGRQEIPAHDWVDNRLYFVDEKDDATYHVDCSAKDGLWRRVRLRRADVLCQWPGNACDADASIQPIQGAEGSATEKAEVNGAAANPGTLKHVSDRGLEIKYIEYVNNLMLQELISDEKHDKQAMERVFPGRTINRGKLRTLRKKHAPVEWRRPGRKRNRAT
jgi:hypothetical protein